MRVQVALAAIINTLCLIDRGDDEPASPQPRREPRPEWQSWLIGICQVGFIVAILMACCICFGTK